MFDTPLDRPASSHAAPLLAGHGHRCTQCDAEFHSARALQSHTRARHNERSPFLQYISSSGVCPICQQVFSTRLRLLAHVSEKRCRGRKKVTCGQLILAGVVDPLPEDQVEAANANDRKLRRAAQRKGSSQPKTLAPAKRRLS
eukprot:9009635-Karenia_brevis.AAC.1